MSVNILKDARIKTGKTQFQMAVETGLSLATIVRYERDLDKVPPDKTLKSLAKAYGVTPRAILEEVIKHY